MRDSGTVSPGRRDPPVSVVFEGRLGPSWLLDRAVERSAGDAR
jgi:hypothetical protein